MSTSPDAGAARGRADGGIVTLLSRWLAGHVDDTELLAGLSAIGTAGLGPEQAEAVEELAQELDAATGRGELEMVVRETLEAVARGA